MLDNIDHHFDAFALCFSSANILKKNFFYEFELLNQWYLTNFAFSYPQM
jgi:hypothetical protein